MMLSSLAFLLLEYPVDRLLPPEVLAGVLKELASNNELTYVVIAAHKRGLRYGYMQPCVRSMPLRDMC
jgi:hypothetical protein